jgi:hypothetical protein
MKVIVMVKATPESEAGVMPSERCPNPMSGESEIEIRPIFEAPDFGDEFTPELRAQEEQIWAAAEKLKNS